MNDPSNPPGESVPDQVAELTPDEGAFIEAYRRSKGSVGQVLARMILTDRETAALFYAWQAIPSEHRGLILHLLEKMGEACDGAGE